MMSVMCVQTMCGRVTPELDLHLDKTKPESLYSKHWT